MEVIINCVNTAFKYGTAVPVVHLKDSIRKIDKNDSFTENRNNYRAVQTPQCFRSDIIKKAYATDFRPEFTDDASVVEAFGVQVRITDGNDENIKITTPLDLIIAESIIKSKKVGGK